MPLTKAQILKYDKTALKTYQSAKRYKDLTGHTLRIAKPISTTRSAVAKAVGMKSGARILGKAMPVVGAAIGAYEIYKAAPKLAKGIPAYIKERKAQTQSKKNLIAMQRKYELSRHKTARNN